MTSMRVMVSRPASIEDQAWADLLPQAMLSDAAWARRQWQQAAKRLRAGKPADRSLTRIAERLKQSAALAAQRADSGLTLSYPDSLPVADLRDTVIATVRERGVLVLTGETGSGKTTQLPKMLLEAGCGRRGRIAMTQPRRVAAISVAARIAEETQAENGQIAHAVRFDDRSTDRTQVRICTDGLLLAEASSDPDLLAYDAVVIDEAHERSLNIDLLLGLLRRLRERRQDLVIVVTSATIDAERIAEYLSDAVGPAPMLHATGRTYPVTIDYQPAGGDDLGYLPAAISAVRDAHEQPEAGDVLVFLPTERDILEAARRLDDLAGATVLPLFGRLTPGEQQRVFQPARGRKIVLATNVAETSLTVPGITVVIDAGLARIKRFQATTGTERLPVEAVAQASCDQRAGRAGRVAPGTCIRLYPEADYRSRPAFADPEIRRSNLAGVQLQLFARGLGRGEDFPWLDAPTGRAWAQARTTLDELGALDGDHLTPLGQQIARLPADPTVARILLAGVQEGVPHEAAVVAAWLSIQEPRVRPPEEAAKADAAHATFHHEAGDLGSALRLWQAWQDQPSNSQRQKFCRGHYLGFRRMREWADVRHQLWQALRDLRIEPALPPTAPDEPNLDGLHRAVLHGLIGQIATWDADERCYRTAGGKQAWLHPASALRKSRDGGKQVKHPAWLVACEVVETSRRFVRGCAPVDARWIQSVLGDRVSRRHRDPRFDERSGRVVITERLVWKGLVIRDDRSVAYADIDPAHAQQIFCAEGLAAGGVRARLPFLQHNRDLQERCLTLAARLRDDHHRLDPDRLAQRYHTVIGEGEPVASVPALKRWLRGHGDDALVLQAGDLVDEAAWQAAERDYPTELVTDAGRWAIAWRYVPGHSDDGATLNLSVADLGRVTATDLDRLVPGWLPQRVEHQIKRLPKAQRRLLNPLRERVAEITAAVDQRASEPVLEQVRRLLSERLGERVSVADENDLAEPYRIRVVVRDANGEVISEGRGSEALGRAAGSGDDPLAAVRASWQTSPAREWPGELPEAVPFADRSLVPILVRDRDEQARVAARRSVVCDETGVLAWHADGVAALIEAHFDDDLSAIAEAPGEPRGCQQHLGISGGGLRRALAVAVLVEDDLVAVRSQEAFAAVCQRGLQRLRRAVGDLDRLINAITASAEQVARQLGRGQRSLAAANAAQAVADDRRRLLAPGWWQRLGWPHLQRMPAYLEALLARHAAATDQALTSRFLPRRQRLLERWNDAVESPGPRLVQAVGMAATAQRAAGALEESLLLLVPTAARQAGRGPSDSGEGRCASLLGAIERAVTDSEKADRLVLNALREVRPFLDRATAGVVRDDLCQRIDSALRAHPDCSLGADLTAQRLALEQLRDAARAWLRA